MRNFSLRLVTIIGILHFLLEPVLVCAQAPITDPLSAGRGNILQISSERIPGCGTGVMISGSDLLINRHLVSTLCPEDDCSAIKLQAQAIGDRALTKLSFQSASLKLSVPTIDFAIVHFEKLSKTFNDIPIATPDEGSQITIFGYPRCNELAASDGRIEKLDSLHLITSAEGNYGSSGSAVLNSKGELVGLVDQATSILSGVRASLIGGGFTLRAIRADVIQSFLTLNYKASCGAEADRLMQFYFSSVQGEYNSIRGLARVRAGLDFIKMADPISHCATIYDYAPNVTQSLLHRGDYLSYLTTLSYENDPEPFTQNLELVIAAYNRELKGLYGTATQQLNIDTLLERLKRVRTSEQYNSLSKILIDNNRTGAAPYVGLQMFALSWGLVLIFSLLIVLTLWAATAGYVFATTQGSWIRRSLVTASTLILFWPLSLLYVWGARIRAKNRARRSTK